MKIILSLFISILLFANNSLAQVKWSVDPAHTNARFEVKHLGIAFVDGQFTKLTGSVEAKDSQNFDGSIVNFEIDVNSIDTRVDARDKHLKSDDFFSSEKFPKMTFSNAVFKSTGNGNYVLTGNLTIKDVTKKVSFEVTQNNGIIIDPWGKTRAGFSAKTTIDRTNFNINYNDKLPSGILAVGNDINITVNVEVVKD